MYAFSLEHLDSFLSHTDALVCQLVYQNNIESSPDTNFTFHSLEGHLGSGRDIMSIGSGGKGYLTVKVGMSALLSPCSS